MCKKYNKNRLMKQCSRCKEDKDLSEFCKRSSSKDGLGILCRSCRKMINSLEKETRKKRWKQYYQKKKRIICAKKILYKLKHPQKVKKIREKSYNKNKEKIKTQYQSKKHQKPTPQNLPETTSKNHSISISEYLNN